MAIKKEYFPALTGVRAVAAYMVFIHHFHVFPKKFVGPSLYYFFEELHIGVTLFFVLSGFLIAFRYYEMKAFSFRNYMINRIARIYPIYFLLTSFTFLYFAFTKDENPVRSLGVYLANISFLRGYFEDLLFTGIPQGWSLTVEETFYLLAPVIFIALRKNIFNLVTIPAILMSTGLLLVYLFRDIDFYGFMGSLELMFNYTFWGRCLEFMTGIALAIFIKTRQGRIKTRNITYVGIAFIVLCVFLISTLRTEDSFGIRHPMGKAINTFFLPVLGVSLFYYGLLTEKTIVSKILSNKFVVLLGKSSYVFYLIHMGVFVFILNKFVINSIVTFVAMNILSIIIFKYVEDPLNHLIRRKFIRKEVVKPSGLVYPARIP